MWDLLLAGGERDIAVSGGKIAAVGTNLGPGRETLDVKGKLITPGLVDMHTHVHAGGSYWGIEPDPVAWYSGVTTWVDAGSTGAYNFESLRLRTRGYQVRVPVLLNISALGLVAPTGEAKDLSNCDIDLAIATVQQNRDTIAGVKVRMDRHSASGLEPLKRAVEVGRACGVPVMVHIGAAPPTIREMLPLLRPGDIITHCASGIAARGGGLDPAAKEAYQMGVLFDIGHGSGGFAFDVLEAQLEAGMVPQTISSDLHARSLHGPVFDLPTTMAKLMAVGLSLEQVVHAATEAPAKALGLNAGTLHIGAPADIAVFSAEDGPFEVVDVHGQRRTAPLRLRNVATYVSGRLLTPQLPPPPPPWISLTPAQKAALHQRQEAIRGLLTAPMVDPGGLTEQFPRHGG
jgi:dihydroorotase